MAALLAVAGILLFLEHHHRGPVAWLSATFGWGHSGVVSDEQKDLLRASESSVGNVYVGHIMLSMASLFM